MKAKIKKIVIGAMSLLLLTTTSMVAHAYGPETHITKNLCSAKFAQYAEDGNMSNCDPENPLNLSKGINSQSHPDGLCFPSFNNYTDEIEKDTGWGMDPYGTIPPLFGDERNFVKINKRAEGSQITPSSFSDSVDVKEGEVVDVFIYIHNDGNPCFNDNIAVPKEKFFSNWNTTSHNTKISFTPGLTIENGKAFIDLNNQINFNGNIWSDDAISENGVVGGKTSDGAIVKSSQSNLRLEYYPDSAYYVDMRDDAGYESWANQHKIDNPLELFKDGGMQLSTLKTENSAIKGSGGDYYASEPYIGLVRFKFKVVNPEKPITPPPTVCENLKASAKEITLNGKPGFSINIDEVKFEGEIPEGQEIIYYSLDPQGEFFILPNTEKGKQTLNANLNQKVVYKGNGPLSLAVKNYSSSTCQTFVELPQPKPLVCDQLKVNYNTTIFQDQVSTFNAKSVDKNYDNFNSMITYSVEPGYGYFYIVKPDKKESTSNTTSEFDPGNPPISVPSGGFCGAKSSDERDFGINISIGKAPKVSPQITDFGINIAIGKRNKATQQALIEELQKERITVPQWMIDGIFVNNGVDPIESLDLHADGIFGPSTFSQSLTENKNGEFIQTQKLAPPLQQDQSKNNFGPSNYGVNATLNNPLLGNNNPLLGNNNPLLENKDAWKIAPYAGTTSLTVTPGTEVYFYGLKEGKQKITVETACSDNKDCSRKFDIAPNPDVCKGSTLDAVQAGSKTAPICLSPEGQYAFKQNFFSDTAKTKDLGAITKVKWESTDPNGKFYDFSPFGGTTAHSSPYIGDKYVTYKGGGKVTSSLYSVDGKLVPPGNVCTNSIKACEDSNKCADLKINSNLGNPLEISKLEDSIPAFFTLEGTDLKGKKLPAKTKLKWSTDTKGEIVYTQPLTQTSVSGQALDLLFGNQPVKFQKSATNVLQPGKITLQMDPSDPLYSPTCKAEVLVTQKLVCESLNVVITDKYTNTVTTKLKPSTEYEITAKANYNSPISNKIKYTIDPAIGTFVKSNFPLPQSANTIEVADGEKVKLLTLDFSGSSTNALRVQAVEYFNTECDQTFGTVGQPPVEEVVCKDLQITSPSKWKVAKGDDKELFEIDVDAENKDKLFIHWEVTKGDGEWKNNKDEYITQGKYEAYLENFDDDSEVEVWASETEDGAKITACKDSIKAKPEDEEDEEEPDFEKLVYLTNNANDAYSLLNIGDKYTPKYDYVTYVLKFRVKDAKSVRIRDIDLNNGKIAGDQGGTLDFKGMRINIYDDSKSSNSKAYTVLKDKGYKDDSSNNKLIGDRDYDDEFGNDVDEYGEEFSCDNNTNKFCIKGDPDDFGNEVIEKFKDGNYIEFNNLKELGNNGVIVIKYQMTNRSKIDTEKCGKIGKVKGCGEKFNNTAKYEAWTTNEPYGRAKFDGNDDAKVIVLCPYVLKRQGGDSFFHDEIDTGVDVAQCSEVKGDDGIDIVGKKPSEEKLVSSGQGKIFENAVLELPSHDICQFSNLNTNLEDYNNVLKNFSSTICELRAEVAENWKETNINKSIEANINLIAAWNNNLKGISTLRDTFPVSANGIYMKTDDNLHIDFSDGNLPAGNSAAKTIIVRGKDLYIDSNIKYPVLTGDKINNPKNFPSLAIIVIDGDIIIDKDVTNIDAAIIALNTKKDGVKGQVIAGGGKTTNLLSIHGNLIGDVHDLFENRKGVGDPKKNEGSVTIFFDQSIILNPPQGLRQLIDVSQLENVK